MKFTLGIEKNGKIETQTWHFPGGHQGLLRQRHRRRRSRWPSSFFGERYVAAQSESDSFAEGEGAMWAIAWTPEGELVTESYVNMIPTRIGGTHVVRFARGRLQRDQELHRPPRDGAARLESRARRRVVARQLRAGGEDARPAVQGPGEERADLARRGEARVADGARSDRAVAESARGRRQAHRRAGHPPGAWRARARRRKSSGARLSGVAVLPGKLTDCASDDPERNELFIVEGDSAGGSAKQARDKEFQAVLPLKGKPKNTWQDSPDTLYANKEIEAIALAIGVDHHKLGDTVDVSGLRYRKIIILADADVDGAHIQVLLLTLFFRHFPKLIESGNVFVAQPPLFRIDVPGQGKGKPQRKLYALDKQELEAVRGKAGGRRRQAGQLDREPLQGPGRDESRAAVGNHAQSRHAPHAAGVARRRARMSPSTSST